jgi:hypothetical protein
MSAFELKNNIDNTNCEKIFSAINESLITFKVYDSCRSQDCITPEELSGAVAAEDITIKINPEKTDSDDTTPGPGPGPDPDPGIKVDKGDIIPVPNGVASVSIDNAKITGITITNKSVSQFKNGYYDIGIQYAFQYSATYRDVNGKVIESTPAPMPVKTTYNKRVCLFGSYDTESVIYSDWLQEFSPSTASLITTSSPFVFVEGKAVALSSKIQTDQSGTRYIAATIGLFTIVKTYRLVTLDVKSTGFSIPKKCKEVSPINPCNFFESLDFPMDTFAPPQKREFTSGTSANIANTTQDTKEESKCDKIKV